ncbi:hypothetical protein G9A89_018376 [Geosiphon pyriformis]|nr:hypothetical protein G9A89_018376 [Geosiphon pyriformis]
MDKTKRLFDKRILQQLEHFVGKNNLSTQARAIYRIHTAFQDKPEILLNKAIDMVTSNQLEKITNAQFEELQTQITQVILKNKIQEILQEGELHDEHSETAVNKENDSEISEEESIDSKNKEDKMIAYIAKIPEFNGEDIETSPQEWLNQVIKAGDANGWNAARMLRTIFYFLKGTAGEWFENLTTPFNN